MIPKKVFFVSGKGVHEDKLSSFECALRDAGISSFNLVYVSSILPPKCAMVESTEGLKDLHPGQIVFCVMAKIQTNEPGRLMSASIGFAVPKDETNHGYISEHHAFGIDNIECGKYAQKLAGEMLATLLEGSSQEPVRESSSVVSCARGDSEGRWTTAISAAVFVI